jgi:hypothetical protein
MLLIDTDGGASQDQLGYLTLYESLDAGVTSQKGLARACGTSAYDDGGGRLKKCEITSLGESAW